jgi:hypothetical protein
MTRQTMTFAALTLAAVLAHGGTVHADDWDVASVGDGSIATRNELFHGSEQVHDLSATGSFVGDQDWYVVESRRFSSYQMVVDGMTGDLRLAEEDVQLLDTPGATVQASAALTDFGGNLNLTWRNLTASAVKQFVRVRGAACGTTCTADDRYRVRFYDTTYGIARFNNSATQTTVLVTQNVTDRSCDVTYVFQSAAGGLLSNPVHTLPARGLDVFPTPLLVANQSGSVRIVHTCGYGGLSGKAVSIEPATGLAFDTPMVHRPH